MKIHITVRGSGQLPPLNADVEIPWTGIDTYQLDHLIKLPHGTEYCRAVKHLAHIVSHMDFSLTNSDVDFDFHMNFGNGMSIRICRPEKYKSEQDFMAEWFKRVKEAEANGDIPALPSFTDHNKN